MNPQPRIESFPMTLPDSFYLSNVEQDLDLNLTLSDRRRQRHVPRVALLVRLLASLRSFHR